VQVELIFTLRVALHRHRAELVHAEVHLVGDVAEVAAAAGGAAVVHLEAGDDALPSTWIALVSCPPMSSTVRVPGTCVRAEAVAEDLGADLLLGERQALRGRSRCRRRRARRVLDADDRLVEDGS
jgi:hypothetical protein